MGDQVSRKSPITPTMLLHILRHLDMDNIVDCNVWAACLVMFFTMLRRSNVLPLSSNAFDPSRPRLCQEQRWHYGLHQVVQDNSIPTANSLTTPTKDHIEPFVSYTSSVLGAIQVLQSPYSPSQNRARVGNGVHFMFDSNSRSVFPKESSGADRFLKKRCPTCPFGPIYVSGPKK